MTQQSSRFRDVARPRAGEPHRAFHVFPGEASAPAEWWATADNGAQTLPGWRWSPRPAKPNAMPTGMASKDMSRRVGRGPD